MKINKYIVYRCDFCNELTDHELSVCFYDTISAEWTILCDDCIKAEPELLEEWEVHRDISHMLAEIDTPLKLFNALVSGKYSQIPVDATETLIDKISRDYGENV